MYQGVAMERVRFHIAQMSLFLKHFFFRIKWIPVNNLAPMRNCPGARGGGGVWRWRGGVAR